MVGMMQPEDDDHFPQDDIIIDGDPQPNECRFSSEGVVLIFAGDDNERHSRD